MSPFQLPLKTGVFTIPDMVFDGLYGVFNDSLPDGWGRAIEKQGVRRGQLTRRASAHFQYRREWLENGSVS